ncbi:MAG: GDSL-type esterase/lipase family protein [Chloroflexota bacterium]|nr:GDSL-type esterase/lipase family protein [Chloroflexota bacterium]
MRESIPSPVSPLLIGSVAAVIFLTIFAWAWAVRRPAPVDPGNAVGGLSHAGPVATPTPRLLTYAAIGASDVVGVGADDPKSESWINILLQKMPAGTRFVRLGRSGITLREANSMEVPQAVAAKPDVITVWNCVNDALKGVQLPEYQGELKKTLTALTQGTGARIAVLNMPDITVLMKGHAPAAQQELVRGGIVRWNKGMADTIAPFGDRVVLVDIFPFSEEVLQHPEYVSPDNFHPSTVGYARLAKVVWQRMQQTHMLEH